LPISQKRLGISFKKFTNFFDISIYVQVPDKILLISTIVKLHDFYYDHIEIIAQSNMYALKTNIMSK